MECLRAIFSTVTGNNYKLFYKTTKISTSVTWQWVPQTNSQHWWQCKKRNIKVTKDISWVQYKFSWVKNGSFVFGIYSERVNDT